MAAVEKPKKVAIIGTGLIGKSWAMLFVEAQYTVAMYDLNGYIIQEAILDMRNQWFYLSQHDLTNVDETNNDRLERIKATIKLKDALEDAFLVMECVPENLELKRKVWKEIDALVGPDVILTSSASVMLPSSFTEHLKNRKNVVVAHPVNPPYYIPLVELVPAPWTDKQMVEKVRELMEDIGMSPVVLKKEITGYVNNRLQYALLNQVINLVNDGVLEPKEIDKVMSEGLGIPFAFIGPLEMSTLNANGFQNYIERYGEWIEAVCKDLKPPPKYSPDSEVIKNIAKKMELECPLTKVKEKRDWRDLCVMKLKVLRNKMEEDREPMKEERTWKFD